MSKLKEIFTDSRVIFLVAVIIIAIFAINPRPYAKGVVIQSIDKNLTSQFQELNVDNERILKINSQPVEDIDDYYDILSEVPPGSQVMIETNKRIYTVNAGQNPMNLGLTVKNVPKSNIQLGLDLQGGTRVILKPEREVSSQELETIQASLKQRLNVYGLRDMVVRSASDLSGNQFVIVEIAGANEQEVRELLSQQGKFEAKIGNKTVFRGGDDITYVCMGDPQCSGIDQRAGCSQLQGGGSICRFMFTISLSPAAAARQANITKDLEVVTRDAGQYLDQPLDLYLDDELVDQLNIAADLKGKATTQIAISGSGQGASQQAAIENSLDNMKRLQTILVTGSLPVKMEMVSTDSISPTLGHEFAQNALLMGVVSILVVAGIVLYKYRKWVVAIPILIITWLEIFFIFGAAALFGGLLGWQIDVPSIAGIIISIGTGVNDQIVITDETLRGDTEETYSWKKKLKKAFYIVFGAYFTTIASMFPLLFAGAELLKGFAITSIIGLTIGVFITRPAFARIIRVLVKE